MINRGRGTNTGFGPGRRGDGFPMNDPRALESLFSQQQFPSIFKEFVHPGKDPKELLMRCIFKDERERNAAVLYYAKCEEFNLEEEKKVLTNWLAGTVSVRGIARRELLMAGTGIIAPTLYPGVGRFGRGRKEEKAEQGEQ